MTSSAAPVHIGIVVKMFPRLSETFILNEILELEAQGICVHIASLRRPLSPHDQGDGTPVRARVTYLPNRLLAELPRVLWANWSVFGS